MVVGFVVGGGNVAKEGLVMAQQVLIDNVSARERRENQVPSRPYFHLNKFDTALKTYR